ncbi:MAG: glycosyltransferase family 4 protein [Thermodesulfobacteriota bacterium]
MRILIVTEYYFPHIGGLERLFQNLAEGFERAGHTVDVVTVKLAGTEKLEYLNGVRIYRVTVPQKGDRYWFTIAALLKTYELTATADVVLTTTYNGAFPACVAAKIQKKPVALFTHEVVGKHWKRIGISGLMAFLYRMLENAVFSLPFDKFICNSESTKAALVEWGRKPSIIERVYPGIDGEIFNPNIDKSKSDEIRKRLKIDDKFVYIFFGRPGFVKGVEYLIKAVPLIKKMVPNSKPLLILSKKPREGVRRVNALIEELNLKRGEDIIILDPVAECYLPHYLKAADCVVVPSLSEGFGFTCVEACATGRPVVASDTTSLPEVIYGRYVLVEPGSPEAIAKGVKQVYDKDYTVTEKKDFLWETAVARHVDIFNSLIEEFAKRRK